MRVHELAKELGVSSKEIVAALEEMGVGGRTASSSVPEEAIPRLRASGGKARPGTKLKEVAEEPAPKPRAKERTTRSKPAAKGDGKAPAAAVKAPADVTVLPAEIAEPQAEAPAAAIAEPAQAGLPALRIARGATPQELAGKTDHTVADSVKILLGMGEMVSATQSLSDETLAVVVHELGFEPEIVGVE